MPPPATATVVWLGSADGGIAAVGGKAASLDRLARLGFRIPPGFCLTTAAFDVQLEAIERAREVLAALPDESARARITEAMERAPIEPALAAELDEAVARLVGELGDLGIATPLFAVRSSGIGEDGSAASYAGLHETELGVRPDGIADAVRRCWASLWSAPAIAYRQRKGLTLDGGGMAVVVQSLVPADASAVVFTRNPVTHTDDLVITAVRGLGEAMVAGTTTPETIVLDRATRDVIDYSPGVATSRLVAGTNGGIVDVPDATDGPALDGDVLDELASLALGVERGFGAPVDIEAAIAGSQWFLLQARPITTS